MNIQAMLNPADESPCMSPAMSFDDLILPRPYAAPTSTLKQDRGPKDGFHAIKADPKAPVTYLPFEVRSDSDVSRQLDSFSVLPDQSMGKFCEYPRYIPYSSSKKDFLEKTGRRGFEGKSLVSVHEEHRLTARSLSVRIPERGQGRQNEETPCLVGLSSWLCPYHPILQGTRLFQGRSAPKLFHHEVFAEIMQTTPNLAVKRNDGLDSLTVSITGGSLAAQGGRP